MIHIVLGKQGTGKTLLVVKELYRQYKLGRKIYSNIHLNFPYEKINYNKIVNCEYENAVIFIDELQLLLSSRNWQNKTSRKICDSFLSMVRKKDLEFYGTTQLITKIDVRVRDEADYIYRCEKFILDGKEFKIYGAYVPKELKNNPTIIKVEVAELFTKKLINYQFLANEYYDKYDTRQIVKIEGINDE